MPGDSTSRIDRLQGVALVTSACAMEVPPRDAVLQRQDGREVVEEPRDLSGDSRDLMRFQSDDYEIVLSGIREAAGTGQTRGTLGAVLIHEAKAVFPDRIQMRSASYDGHVMTGGCQLHCKVTADRSRTYNADLHASNLSGCLFDSQTRPRAQIASSNGGEISPHAKNPIPVSKTKATGSRPYTPSNTIPTASSPKAMNIVFSRPI